MIKQRCSSYLVSSFAVVMLMADTSTAVVVQAIETDVAPSGPAPDTTYSPVFAAGGPSAGDILQGMLPFASNGDFVRTGSTGTRALTDGSIDTFYGAGINEDIHAAYLSAGAGESVTYALGGVFDLTSIAIYGGWLDGGRDAQHYDLQISTDGGRSFATLSTLDINPGVQGTDITPVSNRVEFTEDEAPLLATGVTTLRVNFLAVENGWTGYTEIDAFGSLTSIPGDADGNGVVNGSDFSMIAGSFGSVPSVAGADGDVNYDDIVDANDFFAWRDAVAATASVGLGGATPEPSSLLVLAVGATLLGSRRTRRTNRLRANRASVPLLAVAALGLVAPVNAQTVYDWNVASGDWDIEANWVDDMGGAAFVPDLNFDEVGHINNGGTAFVDGVVTTVAGGVVLGNAVGDSGALEIRSAGTLSTGTLQDNLSTGATVVGAGGTGTLSVLPGGTLATRSLVVGGNAASSVTFGGSSGGTATIDVDLNAFFDRVLRVAGSVDFNANEFVFGGSNVFIPELTSATSSPLRSQSGVSLGGTLRPEYSGPTPAVGTTWALIDATGIAGGFDEVDTSGFPALPFGQVYEFQVVADPGSVNGLTGQLAVEQKLVLNVNRATGEVAIANGPAAVDLVGYSIGSTLGGLDAGGWNSLQDQAIGAWTEAPGGGSSTSVSELLESGIQSVDQGSPLAIGGLFSQPVPTDIGQELEDLTFQYFTDAGEQVEGIVNYTGQKVYNNVVLSVDPSSGEARLANESSLSAGLVGYRITSESGSLEWEDGGWNSLDDADAAGGDWDESNPSPMMIAELKPVGETVLAQGVGFDLGALFQTVAGGGAEDLQFQFLLQGEDAFRDGVVVYRSLPTGVVGDYNNDGTVDAADYTVWRDSLGDIVVNGSGADGDGNGVITVADYSVWRNNYTAESGNALSGASLANVPEPAGMMLLFSGCCALACRSRRSHR